MKSRILLLLVFLAASGIARSQSTNKDGIIVMDSTTHQIGLNIAPSLKDADHRFPALDYRYFYKTNRAFRVQIGFDGGSTNTNGESNTENANFFPGGTRDTIIRHGPNSSNQLNIRAGQLWYFNVAPRTSIYLGAEGVFQYNSKVTKLDLFAVQSFNPQNITEFTTVSKTRTFSHQFGISPSMGISQFVSKRVCIMLESSMGFYWGTSTTKKSLKMTQRNIQTPNATVIQNTNSHQKTKSVDFAFDPFIGLLVAFTI